MGCELCGAKAGNSDIVWNPNATPLAFGQCAERGIIEDSDDGVCIGGLFDYPSHRVAAVSHRRGATDRNQAYRIQAVFSHRTDKSTSSICTSGVLAEFAADEGDTPSALGDEMVDKKCDRGGIGEIHNMGNRDGGAAVVR